MKTYHMLHVRISIKQYIVAITCKRVRTVTANQNDCRWSYIGNLGLCPRWSPWTTYNIGYVNIDLYEKYDKLLTHVLSCSTFLYLRLWNFHDVRLTFVIDMREFSVHSKGGISYCSLV